MENLLKKIENQVNDLAINAFLNQETIVEIGKVTKLTLGNSGRFTEGPRNVRENY